MFENSAIAVIGGAKGIGAATVRRLLQQGANVAVADVDSTGIDELIRTLDVPSSQLLGLSCDISDEASVSTMISDVVSHFGRLTGIHVNAADQAAASVDSDVVSLAMEIFDRTIAVNLRGFVLCAKYALPALLDNDGGSIVCTSSRAGITSERTRVSYAISKSGIHALVRHIALRWGKEGIRANAVAPGTILTPPLLALGPGYLEESERLTMSPRLGQPEDVAAMVTFLLSEDAAFVNGQVLSVDGGRTMR